MIEMIEQSQRPVGRNRPSTARAFMNAERDRRIAFWVERMPSAGDYRIAGLADANAFAVRAWRKASGSLVIRKLGATRAGELAIHRFLSVPVGHLHGDVEDSHIEGLMGEQVTPAEIEP
jgi:hypothetical protein